MIDLSTFDPGTATPAEKVTAFTQVADEAHKRANAARKRGDTKTELRNLRLEAMALRSALRAS